jgi:hypothetical protein
MGIVGMKRATGISLVWIGLLAAGCQLKPAKPMPPPQTGAIATIPVVAQQASSPVSEPPSPEPTNAATNPETWNDDPLAQSAPAAVPSNSRLRIITWDFGTIAPGTKVHHQFSITNNDSRTWTIRDVSRTCGCTLGDFTPSVLKPAATGTLNVEFRAGAKQAQVAKSIVVEFKEPKTPVFQLVIQGEVSDALSAVPASVRFGRVSAGTTDALTRSLEVRNNSLGDVAITKIECPDWLRVEYQPVADQARPNAPRQRWSVLIRAEPTKLRPGLHTATIVLHTNGEGLEPVRIPVGLYRNGSIEPIPSNLTFEPVASGKTTQKTILLEIAPDLQGLGEEDLELTHNFGEELEIQTPRRMAVNRFLVTAQFRPKRSPGKVKGELVIRAKGQDVEPARVKIFGEVR